jgi:DNA-binding transcriptional MerR regulator
MLKVRERRVDSRRSCRILWTARPDHPLLHRARIVGGPVKSGRAAAYTSEHLARLEKIKELQAKGRMLSEIGRSLTGTAPEKSAAPPTAWWQHAIADDVVIMTRADAGPWRTKQIRAAIEEFARNLPPASDEKRSRK